MALVVETGSGSATAESYTTVAQLKAYAVANGASVPASITECEVLLRKAMAAMQRGDEYQGCKYTKAQALDFPRAGVVIDDFSYATTEIPAQLIAAQCLYAIAAQTIDLLPTVKANAPGAVIERTVGPLTTRFADSGMSNAVPKIEAAERVLRPLLRAKGNSIPLIRS